MILEIMGRKEGKIFMEDQPIYNIEKRLDSMKSARQFQAKAITAYDQGKISAEKLKTLSTAMNTLLRALEADQLERRLDELERMMETKKSA